MNKATAMSSRLPTAVGTLVLISWLSIAQAQQPDPPPSPSPPSFPAEVEVVTVDVVVTDGKRAPVTDLSREDFVVEEDGRPQAIESFEAVRVPPPPTTATAPPPRVSTNQGRSLRRGRTYVLVFDDVNLTRLLAQQAKAAIADFLKSGTQAGDRVLLLSTSGEAWWSSELPEVREELVAILRRLEGRSFPDTGTDRITPWEAL
jgi:VWFA-related protein